MIIKTIITFEGVGVLRSRAPRRAGSMRVTTTGPGLPSTSLCTAIHPCSTPSSSTESTVRVSPSPSWSLTVTAPVGASDGWISQVKS